VSQGSDQNSISGSASPAPNPVKVEVPQTPEPLKIEEVMPLGRLTIFSEDADPAQEPIKREAAIALSTDTLPNA
jgi:hypothetical protein